MTSRDFCYWLQGWFELEDHKEIGPETTKKIRNHLNMVFRHEIDPSFGDKDKQEGLAGIHSGGCHGVLSKVNC